jgi:glycosyltransferase involved in cell wall biosynthesis
MRLLQFTAGAGAMYCGSCLHSNTLALHLAALSVDVTLVPLYTPTRTDEKNASTGRVFLGGVSVFLEQSVPFLRSTPKIFDSFWDSNAALYAVGLLNTSTDPAALGPLTVSMLKGEAGHQKKEFDHLSAWLDKQPRFDVALIPYTLLLGLAPALRARGLKVACELQGEDLFLDGLTEPSKSEAKALIAERAKDVDLFIAGSRYYADMMSADLKIPREKITVVSHGIDIDERLMTMKSAHSAEFTVGFFARIAPEKGLHVLADAYIKFRQRKPERKTRLAAGGYLAGEHRPYLLAIEDKLRAAGREPEFHYYGSPDREGKFEFLRSLDLLAAPTPYREPKGLFAMEAMACGVPVVLPRHGAFPELIEATDGGVLHTAGNEGELVDALERLADDGEQRKAMGARGARAVRDHFAAPLMAARTKDLLAGLGG